MLTFLAEEFGNGLSCLQLDSLIEINKVVTEGIGNHSADGRFPRSHETRKIDPIRKRVHPENTFSNGDPSVARYRLLIEYDGTDFHGWQRQPNATTIQAEVEAALEVALRQPIVITGSGRTDAGVHARAQVAHFDIDSQLQDLKQLRASLNALTPRAIAIRNVCECESDFHARFDAIRRSYTYRVSTVPIALDRHVRVVVPLETNFDLMNGAADFLIAKRDYSCFCLTQSETKNRVCDIVQSRWKPGVRNGDWDFDIAADRFLHGMVRAIVGTLLQIGQKNRSVSDLTRIIESKDRREAGPAAPARGLSLEEVLYD